MNMKLAAGCLVAGALMLPLTSYAADSDSSSATAFVKDSVITTQVKAELAEKKLSTLVHIGVDTDNNGMRRAKRYRSEPKAVNKAVSIARAVKGVTSVENHIQIAADSVYPRGALDPDGGHVTQAASSQRTALVG